MALVEGAGALLTLYWITFNPSECHSFNNLFTCETPPFWVGLSLFMTFAAGVIVPASGLVAAAVRMLHSSRRKAPSPLFSATNSLGAPSVERMPRRFRLFILEVMAYCFLIATGVGLYIVHWLYTQFYSACYLVIFSLFPLGVNCSNIFANALFAEWVVATVLFCSAVAVLGSLVRGRKFSEKYRLPKEGQSSLANVR